MILLNDFSALWNAIQGEANAVFSRVGASGWYILGKEVSNFETALAKFCGRNYAVGCGNGLDALQMSLLALGIKPGDKVLTTPLSAFATTLAVMRCAAVPIFCDVDDSGLLDLARVEKALAADRSIRFLMPVHLYGHALDLSRLAEIKQRFSVLVVEDCAQAIGATSSGRPVGSVGDCAGLSFYPTKNLGCLGDGGAVLTDDEDLATRIRTLRDYGQSSKYVHDLVGLNSRLDEVQAALMRDVLLPKLAAFTQRRSQIASSYRASISNPHLTLPPKPPESESVWHLFPVLVRGDRKAFQQHLSSCGVQSAIHYPVLIPEQQALHTYGCSEVVGSLSLASQFASSEVSIPIHPFLADQMVSHVVDACNSWRG